MKSFDEFYWKHNDCLNKDTSLAHSFGEKVWNHKKAEVDELRKRIDDLKAFCIKGVESNMLSIEYNQALIDMYKILKGDQS